MLPVRTVVVASDEPEALSAAQPERGRLYVRIRRGGFEGRLTERSDGSLALARESWSSPLRVLCARPASYVSFSAVLANDGATWCGVSLGRRSVVEVDRDWELTSRGPLEFLGFGVRRDALEEVERRLAGGALEAPPLENRALPEASASVIAEELRRRVQDALPADPSPPRRKAYCRGSS